MLYWYLRIPVVHKLFLPRATLRWSWSYRGSDQCDSWAVHQQTLFSSMTKCIRCIDIECSNWCCVHIRYIKDGHIQLQPVVNCRRIGVNCREQDTGVERVVIDRDVPLPGSLGSVVSSPRGPDDRPAGNEFGTFSPDMQQNRRGPTLGMVWALILIGLKPQQALSRGLIS